MLCVPEARTEEGGSARINYVLPPHRKRKRRRHDTGSPELKGKEFENVVAYFAARIKETAANFFGLTRKTTDRLIKSQPNVETLQLVYFLFFLRR